MDDGETTKHENLGEKGVPLERGVQEEFEQEEEDTLTTQEQVKVVLIEIGSTMMDEPSMEEMAQRELELDSKSEIKTEMDNKEDPIGEVE